MPDLQDANVIDAAERRRAPRYPCGLDITIEWGAAVLAGKVKEISAGGMFVEISGPLWVGACFAAQLALNEPVGLNCAVRRVEPQRGMALSYTVVHESGRAAISSLLIHLATP